jgi:hypothetical protein
VISLQIQTLKCFGLCSSCFFGVVAFSYATGTLSSILSTLDETEAKAKEKINVLDEIRDSYNVGPALYEEIMQALLYEVQMDLSSVVTFVDNLPHRLKLELSVKIHREILKNIPFLKGRDDEFIAFIGPLLKPYRVKENEYIYHTGAKVKNVYFMSKGVAAFVIPK